MGKEEFITGLEFVLNFLIDNPDVTRLEGPWLNDLVSFFESPVMKIPGLKEWEEKEAAGRLLSLLKEDHRGTLARLRKILLRNYPPSV